MTSKMHKPAGLIVLRTVAKTDVSQRSLATIRSIAGFMSFEVYSYGSKFSMQHAADRVVLFIDWG